MFKYSFEVYWWLLFAYFFMSEQISAFTISHLIERKLYKKRPSHQICIYSNKIISLPASRSIYFMTVRSWLFCLTGLNWLIGHLSRAKYTIQSIRFLLNYISLPYQSVPMVTVTSVVFIMTKQLWGNGM